MSKRKKTRQQKIIADLRRELQSTSHLSFTNKAISINENVVKNTFLNQEKQQLIKTETIPAYAANRTAPIAIYSYLFNDLKKTFVLTTSIIVIELLLFFLLRNHVIILPNLSF